MSKISDLQKAYLACTTDGKKPPLRAVCPSGAWVMNEIFFQKLHLRNMELGAQVAKEMLEEQNAKAE